MTDDATLSDFAGDGTGGESEVTDDGSSRSSDGDEPDTAGDASSHSSDGDEPNSGPPEPASASSTYAWGEYTCSHCKTAVDRVWRDDGRFVCPDCKAW